MRIVSGEGKSLTCPVHGAQQMARAVDYSANYDRLHIRAACPVVGCQEWLKINNSGPWFIPRALVGETTRVGYYGGRK